VFGGVPIFSGVHVWTADTEGADQRAARSVRLGGRGKAAYTRPMLVVGAKDRSEIELDPGKAHRRGLVLDAMLKPAAARPARGVFRGTHAHFNRLDEARQALIARALNVR